MSHNRKTHKRHDSSNGKRLAFMPPPTIPIAEPVEPRRLLSTFTVNTTSDVTNASDGLTTLREAIVAANAHAGSDTINFSPSVFAAGVSHTITLSGGQLEVSDTLGTTTISGRYLGIVVVNGANKTRVLQVDANTTVSINGVTLTHGSSIEAAGTAAGGGISNAGTLSLTNVAVTGSAVQGLAAIGGGIYSTGPLTISNSLIVGNAATGSGTKGGTTGNGAPAAGAGIYVSASFALSNSTVSGNTVTGGDALGTRVYAGLEGGHAWGGGILAAGSGPVTITNCVIESNVAVGGRGGSSPVESFPSGSALGGGVYSKGELSIDKSSIRDNHVTGGPSQTADGNFNGAQGGAASGGGVYATSFSVSNSTISGNTATGGAAITDSPGAGSAFGGGIGTHYYAATGAINNSTISGNVATGGAGQMQSVHPAYHDQYAGSAKGGVALISKVEVLSRLQIAPSLAIQ
jgi:hypothetical protein